MNLPNNKSRIKPLLLAASAVLFVTKALAQGTPPAITTNLLSSEQMQHTFRWGLYSELSKVYVEKTPEDIVGKGDAAERGRQALSCNDQIRLLIGELNILEMYRSQYLTELYDMQAQLNLDNARFRKLIELARSGTDIPELRHGLTYLMYQWLVDWEELAKARRAIKLDREQRKARAEEACARQQPAGVKPRSDVSQVGLVATLTGALADALKPKLSSVGTAPVVVPIATRGDLPALTLAAIVPGSANLEQDIRVCFSDNRSVLATLRVNAKGEVAVDKSVPSSSDATPGTKPDDPPCVPYLRRFLKQ